MREHGWLLTKKDWNGWIYECFFCKKKLVFYSGLDHKSSYHADETIVVGWTDDCTPHNAGQETAEWFGAMSCRQRFLEMEDEFEVAKVMTL